MGYGWVSDRKPTGASLGRGIPLFRRMLQRAAAWRLRCLGRFLLIEHLFAYPVCLPSSPPLHATLYARSTRSPIKHCRYASSHSPHCLPHKACPPRILLSALPSSPTAKACPRCRSRPYKKRDANRQAPLFLYPVCVFLPCAPLSCPDMPSVAIVPASCLIKPHRALESHGASCSNDAACSIC